MKKSLAITIGCYESNEKRTPKQFFEDTKAHIFGEQDFSINNYFTSVP